MGFEETLQQLYSEADQLFWTEFDCREKEERWDFIKGDNGAHLALTQKEHHDIAVEILRKDGVVVLKVTGVKGRNLGERVDLRLLEEGSFSTEHLKTIQSKFNSENFGLFLKGLTHALPSSDPITDFYYHLLVDNIR